MLRGTLARLSKLAGLCLLVLAAGCFQVEQKYIVYSDGSGKFVQTVTMDQGQMEMLKGMAPPGAAGGGAGADITKTLEGTIGQKAQFVAIAYYEDISKVKQPGYTFGFTKRDDGGVDVKVEMDLDEIAKAAMKGAGAGMSGAGGDDGGEDLGETPSGEGGEGEEAPGGMGGLDPGMMEGFMSQMQQSIVLVLPGDVTSASVGEKSGRVVTYVMAGHDLSAPKAKKISIEASCGAPTADAKTEFEAFRKELDAAKKASGGSDEGK